MKWRYFFVLATLAVAWMLSPSQPKAEIIDMTGGVRDDYTYQEYVFITGKPVKFTANAGDIKVTRTESKGKITETYSMTLTGPNKNDKLTRSITYQSDVENYDTIGQSTANGRITKYTETITLDGVKYSLVKDGYQITKGRVTDNLPASSYFDEIIGGTKKYEYTTKDGEKKNILIELNSKVVGYENFWGATETQITEQTIHFADGTTGTVKNAVSSSKSRVLEYERNPASLSSFYGGYYVKTEVSAVSKYDYELPKNRFGTLELNASKTPTIERLIVPKFRDLSNHWAKDSIEKLYSLGIFDEESNFFSPNTPMTRLDFTVAIGKAVDLRVLDDKNSENKKKQKIFPDLDTNAKNYEYIVSAVKKGIIKGKQGKNGERIFDPNGYILREQAAAIFVRALGLEAKAPDPGYKTHFNDDANISDYARDGIYVASELGLMNGDEKGNFRPKEPLTRAQAAAIIVRFLEYLESDLKQNYRDDILFFE